MRKKIPKYNMKKKTEIILIHCYIRNNNLVFGLNEREPYKQYDFNNKSQSTVYF